MGTPRAEITNPEIQKLVLGLLESQLGKGKPDKLGNYTFYCPVCKHKKPKLVINIKSGVYNCWTCHPPTKGRNPVSLFKKLSVPGKVISEMKQYFGMKTTKEDIESQPIVAELPKEYVPITFSKTDLYEKKVVSYLKLRGLSESDILKYQIGYCVNGRYRDRVIIPSFDSQGKLNYFVARSIDPNKKPAYDAPSVKKTDIIGFEYYVNFNVPVVLCEGVFDAMAIKRNAIPLFGKTIPKALMMKLVQSQVKTIYLALDKDALKESYAYAEELINMGKEVYFLDMDDKDPSILGFSKMVEKLQQAKPMKTEDLFFKKMELILATA
jgi:DNA primase